MRSIIASAKGLEAPPNWSYHTGIGVTRLNEMLRTPRCPFVVYNGNRKLVKRIELEKYIEKNRVI